ncbi:class II fructose-bisphosphate aldolase [Hoeflea poritis]|uniref:Class II fructose-bisphosphate aldolase n=1 Tax=Hoeflea poritis TaxID=2993659 RepID=A0ABT4VKI6_9HYPH|nr:class II fructose-bisphosphate aldolase [Hoeflea poritis]MDA4844538.1 class II fructose-bisphosphate aldolase [Hoeflea poritis]
MTLATLREVLQPAAAGNYAVAGLVVLGWEDALAFVQAAEETGRPIILQAGPGSRKHTPVSVLGAMFRALAEQVSVPVVCHIDHARSIEECREGIDCGFTSVMFDGSELPIEENIALTARICEDAHSAGVSVEGEVGFVGYAKGKASAMTSVEEAARFDRESGADAMAISVGNVHLQTEAGTQIDMDRFRQIEAATNLPLVLHGGSGVAPETRRELATTSRVCKFNIGTELRQAFGRALRQSLKDNAQSFDRIELLKPVIPAIREEAVKVISGLSV